MQRPLTILLPVRNAQSTLAGTVAQVLDMAADMSERFEVFIIDDASSDSTLEVACDLRARYPQIRVLRHKKPLGEEAAMRSVLAQTRGEVVCVRDQRSPVLEPMFPKNPPARPNFLDRARVYSREGL